MLAMQGVVREQFDYLDHSRPTEGMSEAWQMGFRSGNAVQLGADLAWDVFIFTATLLFGLVMLKHPQYGKVLGAMDIILGVLGLVFNFLPSVWPTNPGTVGLVDVGPFSGLWYLAIFIQLLRQYRFIGNDLT